MARNKREPGAGGGETGEGVGTPAERQGEQQSGSRDVRAFSATVRCQISGEHKWVGVTASCPSGSDRRHRSPKEPDMIEVHRTGEGDPLEFGVVVRKGKGETRHHVTMAQQTCDRLTAGKHTPELCLEAAFRFLLDRAPTGPKK